MHAEYEVVSEQFNARFMKAKERALDAIQLSGDLDRKGTVRQGLDDLNRLTTALLLMAKQIAGTQTLIPDHHSKSYSQS